MQVRKWIQANAALFDPDTGRHLVLVNNAGLEALSTDSNYDAAIQLAIFDGDPAGHRECLTCSERHHPNAHCADCATRCGGDYGCRADHVCERCCR
jgi:hypothetical protein